MSKLFNMRTAAAALVLSYTAAASAAVDVTELTDVLTDVATVGAAVFAIAIGVKLFKWVRAAL